MSNEAWTIDPATLRSPTDSVTLITGGASGIGLQTAILLSKICPNNRIAVLDLNPPTSAATKELINSSRFLYIRCNLIDWKAQRRAFEDVVAKFGSIDNVFVNAGIAEYKDQFFNDETDDSGKLKEPDKRVYTVDINAASDTARLAIYHMRHRNDGKKGGSIVMTASLAGYLASAGAPLYSAAKHAIVGLMRALKNDCAKLGIAVSVVAPGITLTDIISGREKDESLSDWAKRMRQQGVPINEPAEIASSVVWLFGQGIQGNGKGLLIQAGRTVDLEAGIARSRYHWMGKEMLDLFRGGRQAPLFPNKL